MICIRGILGLWLILTCSIANAQVRCTLSTPKTTVLVGEKFEFTLTLDMDENDTIPFFHYKNIQKSPNRLYEKDSVDFEPFADIELLQSEPWKNIVSEDYIRPDTRNAKKINGRLVFTNTFQAAIYNPGIFTLSCPETKNGNLLDTSRLVFEVVVPEIDSIEQLADADIYPNKPIDEEPGHWSDYLSWLYLLLAIALLYFLLKKRKKQEITSAIKPVEIIPEKPWEKALRLLAEAEKTRETDRFETKEYYSRLSYILREYIENQVHIPALELSSTEILDMAGKNPSVDPQLLSSLQNILHVTDRVKFAKAEEAEDTAYTMAREIRHFVLTTKPAT